MAKAPKIKFDVTASDPDKAITRTSYESPRPGRYVAVIQDVNTKDGRNDDGEPDPAYPMLEVVYEITDADKSKNKKYAGARLWSYVMLPGHPSFEATVWKLDQLLQATGLASKKKRKGTFSLEDLQGLEVEIIVRAGTAQDKKTYRGEVGQVLAYDEDTFGADDDDEDDDEEIEDIDEDVDADDEDDDEELEDEEDEDEDEDEEEADEDEEEEDEEDEDDLASMSLKDLKAFAREQGLRISKGMTRDDIIEALSEEDEDEEEEEEEEEEPAPKPRKKSSAKKPAAKKTSTKKSSAKRSGKKGKDGFPFK